MNCYLELLSTFVLVLESLVYSFGLGYLVNGIASFCIHFNC